MTFVCLGEEIILQTISFKEKKIFKITRKIYKYFCFLKEKPNAKKKKAHNESRVK